MPLAASGRMHWTRHRAIAAVVAALLVCAGPAMAQTPVEVGFRDFNYGTSATSAPTGEKPESKLWWHDGSWWGMLFNPNANQYRIYRLDAATQGWIDTGTAVDNRKSSRGDVLWDESGSWLYVVSHIFTTNAAPTTTVSHWGRLYRYSYDVINRRYVLDAGFPVTITKGKAEALTIAKDSAGRLWITYVESGRVLVNRSLSHDADWGTPFVLPVDNVQTTVTADDISAILAFGGSRIGVMWSNQNTKQTYFSYRDDWSPDTAWSAAENVLAGCSGACSDDHINLKTDQFGHVYAALKTSLSNAADALVVVARRDVGGTWTYHTFGQVRDHHTRPILLLNEEHGQLFVFATAPESGGGVYYKSAPLDAIAFSAGRGTAFIYSSADTRTNNPTSTKQNVTSTTGVLVLASDPGTRFYLHNFLPLASAETAVAANTTTASTGAGAAAGPAARLPSGVADAAADRARADDSRRHGAHPASDAGK